MSQTPQQLQSHLRSLFGDDLSSDPDEWIALLETRAKAQPANRSIMQALLQLDQRFRAERNLPPTVGDVRREKLVRWDHWTSTWLGVHLPTGKQAQVRTLHPGLLSQPLLHRTLLREGRVLQDVLKNYPFRISDAEQPSVALLLPSTPHGLLEPNIDERAQRPNRLAQLLGSTLSQLNRWDAAGLGMPLPSELEIYDGPKGLHLLCLTPTPPGPWGEHLASLSSFIEARQGPLGHDPVSGLIAGLQRSPINTLTDAIERFHKALREMLVGLHHRLTTRALKQQSTQQSGQLHGMLSRLVEHCPPPQGQGGIGVSLEGKRTIVHCTPKQVLWGVEHEESKVVYTADDGLNVKEARKLLRFFRNSPDNPRIQHIGDEQPEFTGQLCRWLQTRIECRTLRLLLEATS